MNSLISISRKALAISKLSLLMPKPKRATLFPYYSFAQHKVINDKNIQQCHSHHTDTLANHKHIMTAMMQ